MPDDPRANRASGESMTSRSLLAVALAYLGVSHVCGSATMLLSMIAGPLGSLIVGAVLLFVAAQIYRGGRSEK
jgi:hypothetical protein